MHRPPEAAGPQERLRELFDGIEWDEQGFCPICEAFHEDGHVQPCIIGRFSAALAALLRGQEEPWQQAALLKDRTRRAIRERLVAGETAEALASDFGVPVAFVAHLKAWQMGAEDAGHAQARQEAARVAAEVKPTDCESGCNPFVASCGAKFCTDAEWFEHMRNHHQAELATREPPQEPT